MNGKTKFEDIGRPESLDWCAICGIMLDDSAWSVCFDPCYARCYARNVWGGDTHEYRAYLCQSCAERLLKAQWGPLKMPISQRVLRLWGPLAVGDIRRALRLWGRGHERNR
jgi:hypothetical protein